MMNLIDRWISLGHNKFNEIGATAASGGLVVNELDDRLTLSEWSMILGMLYVLSMLIPRLFEFVKWLYSQWEKRKCKKVD